MDKYRNFGWKPKYNFGDSQNITLTKSKYNLRSKYNLQSKYNRIAYAVCAVKSEVFFN